MSKNLLVCKCLSAFPQLNNLEKAVAAAHTFLKKNPTDPSLTKNMKYYKTLFDVEEYLVDHEERPYEVRCRASCGYEKSKKKKKIKPALNKLLLSPPCSPSS